MQGSPSTIICSVDACAIAEQNLQKAVLVWTDASSSEPLQRQRIREMLLCKEGSDRCYRPHQHSLYAFHIATMRKLTLLDVETGQRRGHLHNVNMVVHRGKVERCPTFNICRVDPCSISNKNLMYLIASECYWDALVAHFCNLIVSETSCPV